jgi:diguanylate cyclase
MGSGSSHPASLRQLILTRVIGLVAVTTLMVAACFVVFSLFPMARQIAQGHFDHSRVQVESDLNAVFSPPVKLLEMSQIWLAGEAPDLGSPEAFNHLFQPVLETSPQITSVVAGTSTGQGWLLLQQTDGSWRNRMTDVPRWGNRHLLINSSPDGRASREAWLAPQRASWVGPRRTCFLRRVIRASPLRWACRWQMVVAW